MRTKAFFAATLAALVGVFAGAPASARARDVWFGTIAQKFGGADYDYLRMFRPDAPWAKSAGKLQVFQMTNALILHESDDTLKMIFADLKRRHMALGVEMGLLAGLDASGKYICGRAVEGYAAPDTAKVVAARIKKDGGELDYIAMDEPLWYGHHVHGPNACLSSPEDLARQIAARVKVVRQIFPNVKIGDVEPLGLPGAPDWTRQILAWTKVYRQIAGEPFSFVRADLVWNGSWRRNLLALKGGLRREGVEYSLIYNGNGDEGRGQNYPVLIEQNDQVWTETAIRRFRAIEADPQVAPDQAVIETWDPWPTHMLPEDRPGTLTNVLLQYVSLR